MPLQKQQVSINFSKGLDTKSDPWQVPLGNFLELENSVFNKAGLLQKRNGFEEIADFSGLEVTSLATFKEELVGLGKNLYAYRQQENNLINRGRYQPAKVSAQSLLRNNFNQVQVDSAIGANSTVCLAYTEQTFSATEYKYSIVDYNTAQVIVSPTTLAASGGGTVIGSPKVFSLGLNFVIIYPTLIGGTQTLQYITVYQNTFAATSPVTISNDFYYSSRGSFDAVEANDTLYVAWARASGNGIYARTLTENFIFTAPVLIQSGVIGDYVAITADTTQTNFEAIYIASFSATTNTAYISSHDLFLNQIAAPTLWITTGATDQVINISLVAQNQVCNIIWERENVYGYDSTAPSSYVQTRTFSRTGVLGTSPGTTALVRSVGLAAKGFIIDGVVYFVAAYQSAQQSTYFIIDLLGNIVAKYAYQNGDGYAYLGLPNSWVDQNTVRIPYLIQFFVRAINKDNNSPFPGLYSQLGINLATIEIGNVPVYTAELGNNLNMSGGFLWSYDGALPNENNFFLYPDNVKVLGIAYDSTFTANYSNGSKVVTNVSSLTNIAVGTKILAPGHLVGATVLEILSPTSFEVSVAATASGTSVPSYVLGLLVPDTYAYSATYEWTDNQGNIIRSAPSLPVQYEIKTPPVSFTADTTTGSNVLKDISSFNGLQVGQLLYSPTHLPSGTYITAINVTTITVSQNALSTTNNATITPYAVTKTTIDIPTLRLTYKPSVKICLYRTSAAQPVFHLTATVLNSKTVDYISTTDVLSDAMIANTVILYTNSAVENTAGPPAGPMTIWDNRLWVIDTEEPNNVWYSKAVIDGTPVEVTDLFTFYITPTNAAQGPTSPLRGLSAMDDKIIFFKSDAMYYVNGTGPDNLGNNSQYSQPVLITGTVGSSLPNSIAPIPEGLVFQSDKGIWLLQRNLGTVYLGAPVEEFTTGAQAVSAQIIPGTNQARFVMNSGIILMYDYFFQQWGSFTGLDAIDSVNYQGLQTLLMSDARVMRELPNSYKDGSNPVLMKLRTAWFALGGIQGFQRAYFVFILGRYISPHKLVVNVAYDFNYSQTQTTVITPTNYNENYGGDPVFGSSLTWGGGTNVEKWRVMLQKQKCDSLQFTITEQYDPSFGTLAGEGLTLSGMNAIIGVKRGWVTVPAVNTAG
jgi:hypothetical protein